MRRGQYKWWHPTSKEQRQALVFKQHFHEDGDRLLKEKVGSIITTCEITVEVNSVKWYQ